jgi:DNA-binding NarL/FixJ family response regulator
VSSACDSKGKLTSRASWHITSKKRNAEEQAHNTSSVNKQEAHHMGRVVALMDDLFFQMKLAETAKQLGVEVKVAANGEALLGLLEPEPKLVIVDLNARGQPVQAIERLRATHANVRVIGFLSHVQRELAAQAQQAGCNEVMPRSSFTQNLAAILGMARD